MVSVAASLGFLIGIGAAGIHWGFAIALLVGGLIAAPLAALLVRIAPAHLLGVAVGGLIVLTNGRTLMGVFEVPKLGSDSGLCCDPACYCREPLCGSATRQASCRPRGRRPGGDQCLTS